MLLCVLILLASLTGCVSPPPPEVIVREAETPAEQPSLTPVVDREKPPRSSLQIEEPPEMVQTPPPESVTSLIPEIDPILPEGYSVVPSAIISGRFSDENTAYVAGIGDDGSNLIIWIAGLSDFGTRYGEISLLKTEPIGFSRRITDFEPIRIGSQGPEGFSASLVQEEREEILIVLLPQQNPYIVVAPRTAGMYTEVRDIDGDGRIELVQYSQMYEAPANREVVLDIFSWDRRTFVLSSSTPMLRIINDFLGKIEAALRDENDAILPELLELATPVEGPPLEALLPADGVNVPLLQELPFDIFTRPWDFPYEFLVRRDDIDGVYRVTIRVSDYPAGENPVLLSEF